MNEKRIFIVMCVLCIALGVLSGCRSGPVFTGAEDIGRLRGELESLRAEYNKLSSDYNRLIGESRFYADYYQSTTDAITEGLGKLQSAGSGMADEILRLRTNNQILIGIIQRLADRKSEFTNGKQHEGANDFETGNSGSGSVLPADSGAILSHPNTQD
jgi:hypothetical protein